MLSLSDNRRSNNNIYFRVSIQKQQKLGSLSCLLDRSQDPLLQRIIMMSYSLIYSNILTVFIPIISFSMTGILFFLQLTPLRRKVFPTFYPITENEFGHAVWPSPWSVLSSRFLLMWCLPYPLRTILANFGVQFRQPIKRKGAILPDFLLTCDLKRKYWKIS